MIPIIIRLITTLAADGSVAVVVTALGVLARKNSDDVGADLCRITFTITHVVDLIRAANGFVSRFAAALTLRAVALGVVDFTATKPTADRLVLFLFLSILVISASPPDHDPLVSSRDLRRLARNIVSHQVSL